jgi:two-component system KDP operon response regulator KdpE
MSKRILVIDDEPSIRLLLKLNLEAQGFSTEESGSATEGLMKAENSQPHLIILDLGLPDLPGEEVLKRLRQWTQVPIIVLTVNDNELSKVELLDAGADDYVTKPFSTQELLSRVKVALRHQESKGATPVFTSGELEVDLARRLVMRSRQIIKVTATEFEILKRLALGTGRVVSQEFLLKDIWGKHALGNSHYLRIYVGQLRKKIERDPANPEHIITEPGVGYRLL